MKKMAKFVRVITVAPIMALLLITVVFVKTGDDFEWIYYMGAVLGLCIIPSLSYPLEKFGRFYGKSHQNLSERDAMRELSIYTSVIGYTLYTIFVMAFNQPPLVKQMALTYMFSGLLMFLMSIIFKIKASGHACGFIGPVVFLCCKVSWWYALFFPVFIFVVWSSLKLKRHTVMDIFYGAIIPIISFVFAVLLI